MNILDTKGCKEKVTVLQGDVYAKPITARLHNEIALLLKDEKTATEGTNLLISSIVVDKDGNQFDDLKGQDPTDILSTEMIGELCTSYFAMISERLDAKKKK